MRFKGVRRSTWFTLQPCSRPISSFLGVTLGHTRSYRARGEQFDTPDGTVTIRFASAEDTLLHKLVWYRLGNEVSDRQWGDVLGVLKVQSGSLDRDYLELWARLLNVSDLLGRARQQQPE